MFSAALLACYAATGLALGFGRPGEWARFLVFRAGLSDGQRLPDVGAPEWRVYYWGADGIAGLENDYYLVFDPTHRLAQLGASGTLPGLKCPVLDRPFWSGWHMLITFNCTLD